LAGTQTAVFVEIESGVGAMKRCQHPLCAHGTP
jgi:hypothetical protein